MAAISTLPQARRRKQTTYGKASRNANAWNITSLADDEDELALATNVVAHAKVVVKRAKSPAKATTTEYANATVKDTYRVEKRETKSHRSPNQVKARSKEQDIWDVPSSDDEVGNSITRRSPPKPSQRRKVDSVIEEQEVQLAPWEQKNVSKTEKRGTQPIGRDIGVIETQRLAELDHQVQQREDAAATSKTTSPGKLISSASGSAAERLKARRQLLNRNVAATTNDSTKPSPTIQKRLEHGSSDLNPTPRKRHRTEKDENKDSRDVEMLDAPACNLPTALSHDRMEDEGDIFTISSSANEEFPPEPRAVPRRQNAHSPRRRKLPTVTRSLAPTMVSAPARLTEMLFDDTSTTEDSAPSPTASLSGPSTPQKPSRSSRTSSPETARKITSTPKQDHLWGRLLSEQPTASPSVLPLQGLSLHTNRRTAVKRTAASRILTKSSSDVGPPRQRAKLVDRLKASAPSSDSDETESGQDDADADDVDMSSNEPSANSQSQSYSQSTVVAESGTRPTYSRVRSYLPEDSFEDGLMLSLPSAPEPAAPTLSRKISKSNTASQQSVYDLPESDDEDVNGRLRTVHDLRAAGSNLRFMDETSDLLDDVKLHDSSGRGRRRNALMELTKKLMSSKAFVEKFFRQGFEQKLLAELDAPADDVADFVLAVALTTLTTEDCPEHAAQSLKERNASSWLARRLLNDTDVGKLAKERKNNMSKAAQATFVEFVTQLGDHDSFWGDLKPASVTTRTVMLKALDSWVAKLRRSGDRSEIVSREEVRAILYTEHELSIVRHDETPTVVSLSVSALESLATLGDTVSWPIEVVQQLGRLLTMPVLASDKLKHLRFLALRLCSTLTSENTRSCKQLSKLALVHSLLESISREFQGLASSIQDIDLDLLVLEMGITVNVTEQVDSARASAATEETAPILVQLVTAFNAGQERLLEAETEEGAAANVAYAYLAVVLAILCRNRDAKFIIAGQLPGRNLNNLIAVVEEFIKHQSRVDKLAFGGEEGGEVWTAFTEMLKGILGRLKIAATEQD